MTAIVLLALNLRTLVASLPPLLTHIRADLGLSGLAAGLLTTLPVLGFGAFAPLAPRLTRRVSIERVLRRLRAADRGRRRRCAAPAAWAPLFAGCALAGLAVAIAQAVLPVLHPPAPPGDDRAADRRLLDVADARRGAGRSARRAAGERARLVGGVARGVGAAGAVAALVWLPAALRPGTTVSGPPSPGLWRQPAGVEREPVHGRAVDGVLRRAELDPDRARGRGLLRGRGGLAAGARRARAARAGVRGPGAGGAQPQPDRRAARDRRVLARRRGRADPGAGRRARLDRRVRHRPGRRARARA